MLGRLDGDIPKLLEELKDDPEQAGLAACARLGRTLGQVGPKTIESTGKGLLVHGEFAALHVAALVNRLTAENSEQLPVAS